MTNIRTESSAGHARRAVLLLAGLLAFSGAALAQQHSGGGHSSGGHASGGHAAGGHYGGYGYGHPGYASGAGYSVYHGGGHYWYQGGYWYRPWGGRWIVAGPPFGAFVPWLPWGYTTLWSSGFPYYYYNDAYYVYRDSERGYEVVPPPEGAPAQAVASTQGDNLFAYPRNGQSADQQATDRYECHKWANEQTGYDPTQTGGGVATGDAPAKRADYFRATTSCLEGRGYSVK